MHPWRLTRERPVTSGGSDLVRDGPKAVWLKRVNKIERERGRLGLYAWVTCSEGNWVWVTFFFPLGTGVGD